MISIDDKEESCGDSVHPEAVLVASSVDDLKTEGDDSKKGMFKHKSTQVKSRKTKNLIKKKVKESSDNNSRVRRTRQRTKISDSTSEIKQGIKDAKKISVSLAKANFTKDNLVNPIAQKVMEAATGSRKMLGAHVSVAGGLEQGFYNALSIGCRSFAFFVRNQRSWNSPPMKDEVVQAFRETAKKLEFPMDQIVVHGSYLINGGSCDMEILNRARACMLDECKRCEQLGIIYYNIHP
ncbi:unnamed protein product, partial [Onchocerca flexuosa]|uniref:AP_endonuc_2 domain-containing protein n=1 Tax=Onchocerca flexuosa TaxID=387005 RepID=A0A183I6K3_9BILA